MTTYTPEHEIYSDTLRAALTSGRSESNVLHEIRKIRRNARMLRMEARKPGFIASIVSYIPAYGAETEIRALIDYCRLRRLAARSIAFTSWFADAAAHPRNDSDLDLLIGPRYPCRYHERNGEQYMDKDQLEHFRRILDFWRRELEARIDEKNARWDLYCKLRGVSRRSANSKISPETEFVQDFRTDGPEQKIISKIEAALQRIDEGTFGYCSETGKPIGIKRLEARPIETICVEARERREQKEKDDWYRNPQK